MTKPQQIELNRLILDKYIKIAGYLQNIVTKMTLNEILINNSIDCNFVILNVNFIVVILIHFQD